MGIGDNIKKEIEEIAVSAVEELIDDSKVDEEEAIDLLSATLDALVPLKILIPGPLGELAEDADDIIFDALAKALHDAFRLDPDKIEERAQRAEDKGHKKLAARRRRRAARVRERHAKRKEEQDRPAE